MKVSAISMSDVMLLIGSTTIELNKPPTVSAQEWMAFWLVVATEPDDLPLYCPHCKESLGNDLGEHL
jgi:hypothetical protein